jgi:hypothetical protein
MSWVYFLWNNMSEGILVTDLQISTCKAIECLYGQFCESFCALDTMPKLTTYKVIKSYDIKKMADKKAYKSYCSVV